MAKAIEAIPERQDIPEELRWKVEDIYASDDVCEADMSTVRNRIPDMASYAGSWARMPKIGRAHV